MTDRDDPRQDFLDLIEAYAADDTDSIHRISERLRASDPPLQLLLKEDTRWEESLVDGYSEFPAVTQTFRVMLGNVLVYEGERVFGSSLEDPTHTGHGGRWVAIRIDDEEHADAEAVLEELGLELDWPVVPPAR